MSEVRDKDILLRVGGRCWDRHGVLAVPGARRGHGTYQLRETFTRSSVGYFLDRDGIIRKAANDKIRDYWPVGLVDAQGRRRHGPLFEPARTNGWATNTENYNHGDWTKSGATITPNTHVAPDGVLASADRIVESALNELHFVLRNVTGMTDNTRSSVWFLVKPAERTWCRILTIDKANTARSTYFNLATGALGTKDAGHDAWIRPLGSSLGYYFIAVSWDAASGATTPRADLRLATADNGGAYAGDGVSGLYVWESGVEVDKPFPSHPGSILPNGLARAADSCLLTANFGPIDCTVVTSVERPLHADAGAAVNLGVEPAPFRMSSAEALIRGNFQQATRHLRAFIAVPGAGTDVQQTVAIPAGDTLRWISQFRNLTTTGGITKLDTGSGPTADSPTATKFDSFGNQTLEVGSQSATHSLAGVLFDLMFLRGLPSHAEAFAAADA